MKQFLHRVLTVVFAAFIFIGIQALGNSNGFQASADDTVVSPQGIYYKGTPDESVFEKTNTKVEGAKSKLKSTADNLGGNAKHAVNPTKKGIEDAAKSSGETVKSPTGIYYKGTPHASLPLETDTKPVDTKNPLQKIADNVREKLNLDEPLPESTKEFLGSTEKRVEKVVVPITGTK
jgi:hypothetical protein